MDLHDFRPEILPMGELPDWHAATLRRIAEQLGVGSDAYFPLIGAAGKLEMMSRGRSYDEACARHGGAREAMRPPDLCTAKVAAAAASRAARQRKAG